MPRIKKKKNIESEKKINTYNNLKDLYKMQGEISNRSNVDEFYCS